MSAERFVVKVDIASRQTKTAVPIATERLFHLPMRLGRLAGCSRPPVHLPRQHPDGDWYDPMAANALRAHDAAGAQQFMYTLPGDAERGCGFGD